MSYTKSEHLSVGAIKAAKANHYLVGLRLDGPTSYDDTIMAAERIADLENNGLINHAVATRAFIILSEATGYSLQDIGA